MYLRRCLVSKLPISLRAGVVTCSSFRVDEWWDYARVTGRTPESVSASSLE